MIYLHTIIKAAVLMADIIENNRDILGCNLNTKATPKYSKHQIALALTIIQITSRYRNKLSLR